MDIRPNGDFNEPHIWHTIQHYSHFFLGFFFFIILILFTLHQWNIEDYSDRILVKKFMESYIYDGWWRRGWRRIVLGITIAFLISWSALVILYIILGAFTYTNPDDRYIGSILWVSACVFSFLALLSFVGVRAVVNAFKRYVSLNVNYTSTIILKRVLKVKVEIGVSLLVVLYTPILYNWSQTIIGTSEYLNIVFIYYAYCSFPFRHDNNNSNKV